MRAATTSAVLARPDVSLRRYAGDYAAHAHGHAQILIGRAGRLDMELDGHAAFVDPSCGLVIPAGVAHAFAAERGASVLVLDAPAQAALARPLHFALGPDAVWTGVGGDGMQLLQAVLAAPRIRRGRRGLDVQRLDLALDAALSESWDTARMAALFHLSPQRFRARWGELMGERTPQQHLRARRLERAALLLRQGVALEAAALQVGYRTASALAFALRRDRGQSARGLRHSGH
jgi:AraC-like DNA-binding protein